jgi:hypothetical protein
VNYENKGNQKHSGECVSIFAACNFNGTISTDGTYLSRGYYLKPAIFTAIPVLVWGAGSSYAVGVA